MKKTLTVIVLVTSVATAAPFTNGFWQNKDGGDQFFKDAKRGWFYYEPMPQPPSKEDEKKDEQPVVILNKTAQEFDEMVAEEKRFVRSIPFNALHTLSAEEFRQTYDRTKDIAIMRPDMENAVAYRRLHSYMLERSDLFANVMAVVNTDSELSFGRNQPPLAKAGF
jgi:conjugal transfer pilus assembly protein TraF